jgi:pimeloyl-ACP methyl ester carboxylesterase
VDFAINPLDGVRIAHRSTGTGPPVVLVHGTALSQVIWRGFGYVRELAADRTVITLDLRGHGRSDKPHQEPSYAMEYFVADVLAVLDRLEIERADYVGYSLGGRVGFSVLDVAPERIGRFVSAAGAAGNRPGAFDRVFFPGCIEVLETAGMDGFIDNWEACSGGKLDPGTRAAFAVNDATALAAYMRAADRDGGLPDERLAVLAVLTVPTLMLVGSQDIERLSAAEHVHAIAPASTLQVIADCTHGELLRHPDALPAISAFLSGG